MELLLPLIPNSKRADKQFIKAQIYLTKKWDQFGSRAAFINQLLNENLNYEEIANFHSFFLLIMYLTAEIIPICSKEKLIINVRGPCFRHVNAKKSCPENNPANYNAYLEKLIRRRPEEVFGAVFVESKTLYRQHLNTTSNTSSSKRPRLI